MAFRDRLARALAPVTRTMTRLASTSRSALDAVGSLFDVAAPPGAAFDERDFVADPLEREIWESYSARLDRYAVLWAFYENSAYSGAHLWATTLRERFGLYAHSRNIFNPAHRIGEFAAMHYMGGELDPDAGDGTLRPSALPIVVPPGAARGAALRRAIGQIWRDSNWQENKSVLCRFGATMGDVALRVVDDAARRKVYLKVVCAAAIRWLEPDPFGNVKGYQIQEPRPDPEWDGRGVQRYVTYTETCTKEGEAVRFRTYRAGLPYDWADYPDGTPDGGRRGPDWTEQYGFVPLVFIKHINVGFRFGWSEYHAALSKIREVDDAGSISTDHARKIHNSPWAVLGMQKPSEKTNSTRPGKPQDEFGGADNKSSVAATRDRMNLVYFYNADGGTVDLKQLVGDMQIGDLTQHTDKLVLSLEREFPELLIDSIDAGNGDTSGRALRVVRQKAEAKVHLRRASYDPGLVRAHQMCISIGAQQGYPGFEDFGRDSFYDGELDHQIGKRNVFDLNKLDKLEELQAEANVLVAFTNATVPLEIAARHVGWSEEEVKALKDAVDKAREEAQQRAADAMASLSGKGTGGNPPAPKESPIFPKTGPETQPLREGATGNPSKPALATRNGSN